MLYNLKDDKYAEFQAKLVPNISKERILGIRIPDIRKYANSIRKNNNDEFLNSLPHQYFEEDILHGVLISNIKDYETCLKEVNKFLPYVDNWAVCDTFSPNVFSKNKDILIKKIKKWLNSKKIYTVRFGIRMLMNHYLDDYYKKEYLDLVNKQSNEYYLNMMIAWFYATALINHYDDVLILLKEHKLNPWVHNKTIQKAIESRRIDNNKKDELKSLKIKN